MIVNTVLKELSEYNSNLCQQIKRVIVFLIVLDMYWDISLAIIRPLEEKLHKFQISTVVKDVILYYN